MSYKCDCHGAVGAVSSSKIDDTTSFLGSICVWCLRCSEHLSRYSVLSSMGYNRYWPAQVAESQKNFQFYPWFKWTVLMNFLHNLASSSGHSSANCPRVRRAQNETAWSATLEPRCGFTRTHVLLKRVSFFARAFYTFLARDRSLKARANEFWTCRGRRVAESRGICIICHRFDLRFPLKTVDAMRFSLTATWAGMRLALVK